MRPWRLGPRSGWAQAYGRFGAVPLVLMAALAWGQSEPAADYVLEDFSRPAALEAWTLLQVEGQADSAAGVAYLHYPQWSPGRDKWPAATLDFGRGGFDQRDWTGYDYLCFPVRNDGAVPAVLKVRLDDEEGQRAQRRWVVGAGREDTCRLDLSGLDFELDARRIVHFNLFMTQPPADYPLRLGPIFLRAQPLAVEEARLLADPLGGSAIGVLVRLSRPALCQVLVRDPSGRLVDQHRERTGRLQWRRAAKILPPGSYEVVLEVVDSAWDGAVLRQDLGTFAVAGPAARPEWAIWYEPSTRKVLHHSRPHSGQPVLHPGALGRQALQLHMARNESEAAQVVFVSGRDASIRLDLEDLRHQRTGAPFPLRDRSVYTVGYVRTGKPREYAVEHAGWWPDPLLPTHTVQAEAGVSTPFWLSLESAADTPPGPYRGQVAVWVDGRHQGHLPLEVEVHEVVLPDTAAIQTAFGIYDSMIGQLYGPGAPAMLGAYRAFAGERRIDPFIADHRLDIIGPAAMAAMAQQERANAANVFYMPAENAYSTVRLEQIAQTVEEGTARLAKGAMGVPSYLYGFDEVTSEQFATVERVFAYLKRRLPDIKTLTTAQDPGLGATSGLDEVVDIWVPLTGAYEPLAAAAARHRGAQVWWYICIVTQRPYANWFIEYPAIEARLLWWMAYRESIQGFLYYTMNRWPRQGQLLRLVAGNRTNWDPASFGTANGDGCLVYAGPEGPVSSIRLENIRDGIEDHLLLCLLEAEKGDGGQQSRAMTGELINSLADFSRDGARLAQVRLGLLEEFDRPGLWERLRGWWQRRRRN